MHSLNLHNLINDFDILTERYQHQTRLNNLVFLGYMQYFCQDLYLIKRKLTCQLKILNWLHFFFCYMLVLTDFLCSKKVT